jgi:hypothetical protein
VTAYFVEDAFSHADVGFYLHVGDSGFDPAILAILASAEDKVQMCKRFGVEIGPDEWPMACLPDVLLADSELSSLKAHALSKNGVLDLRIAPSYRADLKGLIESAFSWLRREASHLPGYRKGEAHGLEAKPDHFATMDVMELNRWLITCFRQRNQRILRNYNLTPEMIADNLVPTPLNLWRWGVKNVGGQRKTWNPDYLENVCLPTAKARITRFGLEYRGLYFRPVIGHLPEFSNWQVQAAEKHSWPVQVRYHPASIGKLWMLVGQNAVPMELIETSQRIATWSFADLKAFENEQGIQQSSERSKADPKVAVLEAAKREIIKTSEQKTELARGTVSKRRKEKVDKPAERKSQQDIIQGVTVPSPMSPPTSISSLLAEDDEQQIREESEGLWE